MFAYKTKKTVMYGVFTNIPIDPKPRVNFSPRVVEEKQLLVAELSYEEVHDVFEIMQILREFYEPASNVETKEMYGGRLTNFKSKLVDRVKAIPKDIFIEVKKCLVKHLEELQNADLKKNTK